MTVKVVHVVPSDVIGGVETAAKSLVGEKIDSIEFHLIFISDRNGSPLNPFNHLVALKNIIYRKPDIIVSSLWWTSFICIIYKVFFGGKLVLFLHSQKRAHWIDQIFTFYASKLSDHILCDSEATRSSNSKYIKDKPSDIISFLHRQIKSEFNEKIHDHPRFLFWGRLAYVKGLDVALEFFSSLLTHYPKAKFYIYGPDCGMRSILRKKIKELELYNNVFLCGEILNEQIEEISKGADFYLQLSRHEGMGMSVIEAMQCGLIPIVTPVGEIPRYCQDMRNSIIYETHESTREKFNSIWLDKAICTDMKKNAHQTWISHPLYQDEFVNFIKTMAD